METNQYKLELARAEAVVASIRVGLMFAGGMTTGVANTTVTGGGWNCAEAEAWLDEVVGQCAPVPTAFDDAIDDIHAAWLAEPDDVDEGTWRGHAFLTSPVVTGG